MKLQTRKKGDPSASLLENFVLARRFWRRLTSRRLLDSVQLGGRHNPGGGGGRGRTGLGGPRGLCYRAV